MSVKEYGGAVSNLIKDRAKSWIKSKVKPIAIGITVAVSLIFLPLVANIWGGAIEASASEQDLTSISSSSWEQFLRYLHNLEGGGEITKNANGEYCYTVQPDGGGGLAVGYGVDIATHGSTLSNLGYNTSKDSLIPVEVVDKIEKEELQGVYDQVVYLVTSNGITLTQYQIFALISRCYNYGFTGGTGQATWSYIYPSTMTFVEAYKEYYVDIDNYDYYGDYTKTDFANGLYTQYMTWLEYAESGTHPEGWEYRRRAEWCLFQTGYYGWGLQTGEGGFGFDEYWKPSSTNSTGTANTSSLNSADYNGTYLSSINGYTFIQYYQNGSSWSSDTLNGYSSTNIGASGCNVTSNAIILSALTGSTITPRQVNNAFNFSSNDASAILNTSTFSQYSSEISIGGYIDNVSVNSLKAYMKEGKIVLLRFDKSLRERKWMDTKYTLCCMCRL